MHDQSQNNSGNGSVSGGIASAFRDGIPKVTKIVAISVAVLSVIAIFGGREVQNLLLLVPGNTFSRFYFWNVFTSGFVEISFFTMIIEILALFIFGVILEPIWGSKEFLKFILIVNAASGILTLLLIVFLFFLTASERLLYAPFFGRNAIIAGSFVALKQLYPEFNLPLFFGSSLRMKQFPFIFLLLNFLVSFIAGWNQFPFFAFGLYVSWFYLRFFQKHLDSVSRGDPSDAFSFASLFPEVIRPFVQVVSNLAFKAVNAVGLLKLTTSTENHLLGGTVQRTYVAGYNTLDRDRRRNLGIRSLEGRLEELKTTQAPPSSSHSTTNNTSSIIPTPQDDAASTSSSTSESKNKM